MTEAVLSELWCHPVKSLRGHSLKQAEIDARGIVDDRRWMLVDENGRFLTQRQQARMALLTPTVRDDGLLLENCDGDRFLAPLRPEAGPLRVRIWDDDCDALRVSEAADAWLGDFLGQRCHLVYMPDASHRQVDMTYARQGDQAAFSDGFPLLLISQASLDDLNSRMASPLPMRRFRPNLVVAGCEAYAEDGWKRIRIGDINLRVVKPCSRCVIPTIDPETAEKHPDKEPMRTLLTYRRRDNKVYFGQNVLHDSQGSLSVGMPVERLE